MKLKTLKEIEFERRSTPWINRKSLYELSREEAKKHIERLEKGRKEELKRWQEQVTSEEYLIIKDKINFGFKGTMSWIKHFFNLGGEIKCGNGSKIKCPVAKEKIVGFGGLEWKEQCLRYQ